MKKKIKTTNYDGTIIEVEVNINVYNYDKKITGRKIGEIERLNKKIRMRKCVIFIKKMDCLLN